MKGYLIICDWSFSQGIFSLGGFYMAKRSAVTSRCLSVFFSHHNFITSSLPPELRPGGMSPGCSGVGQVAGP